MTISQHGDILFVDHFDAQGNAYLIKAQLQTAEHAEQPYQVLYFTRNNNPTTQIYHNLSVYNHMVQALEEFVGILQRASA